MSKTRSLTGQDALAVLDRVRHGHLAGVDERGTPLVRPLHHTLLDGALYFHGRVGGSKDALLGRPVVFSCVEEIAAIPSHWIDARRACPATTYYRSVQVEGSLVQVSALAEKERAMAALMARLQPEGGHLPIDADAEEYGPMLRTMAVWRLDIENVSGRINVGQSRGADTIHSVLRGLWRRAAPGDLAAIETILGARTDVPRPAWLRGPNGIDLVVHVTPERARQAAALLESTYWNGPHTREALEIAQLSASGWVGAVDTASGRLVGTCAALGNRRKHAWVFDVAVDEDLRGRGLGTALVRLLLDHAAVREARLVALRTLDAHTFYTRFGFTHGHEVPNHVGSSTMLRLRSEVEEERRVHGVTPRL